MSVVEPLIEAEDSVPDGDLGSSAEFAPDLPEGRFSNRELSWLKYSERVLAQGEDVALPLLERMKFLAIFATNLDEFYMVRVAGLKRRADMGLQVPSPDGLSPREVLGCAGRAHRRARRPARPLLPRRGRAGARCRRHPHPQLGRSRRRGAVSPGPLLPQQDLPGA